MVFAALVVAFAVALWATILRPPAYEVRGQITARPAANLILVRHEPVPILGMPSMELMAIFSDPALLDRAGVIPGDRVRLAVRPKDTDLTLLAHRKTALIPPQLDAPLGDSPPFERGLCPRNPRIWGRQ